MEKFTGEKAYAKYSTFSVGTESQKYKLTVGGYKGNAGRCITRIMIKAMQIFWIFLCPEFTITKVVVIFTNSSYVFVGDSLAYSNGMKFSTPDQDQNSCAINYHAGWWFKNCFNTNPNGMYLKTAVISSKSVNWHHFGNEYRALKKIRLMIRLM